MEGTARSQEREGSDPARVAQIALALESACRSGERPDLADYLPELGDPVRLDALHALIKVDLSHCWAMGSGRTLDDYADLHPEFGGSDTWPAALIFAELQSRALAGRAASHAELERRFRPRLSELMKIPGLVLLLDDLTEESSADGQRLAREMAAANAAELSRRAQDRDDSDLAAGALSAVPGARYAHHQLIARGGMGEVLEVYDQELERAVAMKTLRVAPGADAEIARRRFLREARIHGRLEHPGIAPLHDLGTDATGTPYFTMKVVRGRSLSQALRQVYFDLLAGKGDVSFSMRQRLQAFRKLCDALAYAHSHSILHRDLKPANVMIGEFGEVQLIDWGLARVLGSEPVSPVPTERLKPSEVPTRTEDEPHQGDGPPDAETDGYALLTPNGEYTPSLSSQQTPQSIFDAPTIEGSIVGTPHFMSPEQASGEVHHLDARSDIYSLGALLYGLLTFHQPVDGATVREVLDHVRAGDLIPPSQRVAADARLHAIGYVVPPELESIALKAMAYAAAERYQTVDELAADVDRFLEGRFVQASHYTWQQRVTKWFRQHRGKILVGLLVSLLAVGGTVGIWFADRKARRSQIESDLAGLQHGLDAARNAAEAVDGLAANGHYEQVLLSAGNFRKEHDPRLATILENKAVIEHRPEWSGLVAEMDSRLAQVEEDALARWLAQVRGTMPADPASQADVPPELARDAAESFRRMSRFVPVAERAGLDLAQLPLWLARASSAQADLLEAQWRAGGTLMQPYPAEFRASEAEIVEQVAWAWHAQPTSPSAAEGFLLLAERSLLHAADVEEMRDIATRFQLAHTQLGHAHPTLAPRCLLGLTRSLLALPWDDSTPFAPDVPAREMALRALLMLLTPRGELRTELATSLAAWSEHERAALHSEARVLLSIARRTCSDLVAAEGLIPDDWNPGTLWRFGGGQLESFSADLPPDPLQAPVLLSTGSVDLAPLAAELGCQVADFRQFRLLPRYPGGAMAILELEHPERPRVVVLTSLDPLEVRAVLDVGLTADGHVQGDFNGDGLADLALVFRRKTEHPDSLRPYVYPGLAEGGYGARIDADPDPAFIDLGERRAPLRTVLAADLDGDGRDELAITRGVWTGFRLEVHKLDANGDVTKASVLVGDASVSVVSLRDGRGLLVSPLIVNTVALDRHARGKPVPAQPRLFRFDGKSLIELPLGWELTGREFCGRVWGPAQIHLDAGLQAALVLSSRSEFEHKQENTWVRWLICAGELDIPMGPRVELCHRSATAITPALMLMQDSLFKGIGRLLGEEALAVLAARGGVPAAGTELASSSPEVVLARMLLAFEHPAEAARMVGQILDDQDHPLEGGTREQLEGLRLRALREARMGRELHRFATELQPTESAVPLFVEALTATIEVSGRFEALLPTVRKWESDVRISRAQRQRLRDRFQPYWESEIAGPVTEVRVQEVRQEGQVTGSIADSWICTDPFVIQPEAPDGWRVRSVGSNVQEQTPLKEVLELTGKVDGHWMTRRAPRSAGVLVRAGDGAFRVTVDFSFAGACWASNVFLGLFPLQSSTVEEAVPILDVGCGGGANVNHMRLRGGFEIFIESLANRRVRLVYEHLPLIGRTRVALIDVERDVVIKSLWMPLVNLPRAPLLRLGVQFGGENSTQATLHSITLAGDMKLAGANDLPPEFPSESLAQKQCNLAMRAKLAGDAEEGARRLDALAASYFEAASEATTDRAELEQTGARLTVEAAVWRHPTAAGELAADFRRLLEEKQVSANDLPALLMRRTVGPETVGLLRAAGAAIDAVENPQDADAEKASPDSVGSTRGFANLAIRLHREEASSSPDPATRARAALEVLAPAQRALLDPDLSFLIHQEFQAVPDAAGLSEKARLECVRLIEDLLAREAGLAVAKPGDGERIFAERPHVIELARTLHGMRQRKIEEYIATAASLGQ